MVLKTDKYQLVEEEWGGRGGWEGGDDSNKTVRDSSRKLLMGLLRCPGNEALPDSVTWVLLIESGVRDEILSC